jgi:hypothetical protein
VYTIYECWWVLKKFKFSPVWRKTDRNSVFHGRDPHILYQLYITVPYTSFYGFWENWNILSKSIGVSLRFYRKSLVWGINWSTLHSSWSGPSYYGSVIHCGPIYDFLLIFEIFKFLLKIRVLPYGFTENCQFGPSSNRNSIFLGRDPHIMNQLYIMVLYIFFYKFWKNQIFAHNTQVLAYGFTENRQFRA